MTGHLILFSIPDSEEEPIPELIEPGFIKMNASKRGRKPTANYDEMFANLPIHYEEVDTLTDGEKQRPACGTIMVPIGHEEIRTELRYPKAKLERIVYVATIYGCPGCMDTENPQFIKDEGISALMPGGYASSSLVSHIMYDKYADAFVFSFSSFRFVVLFC
jgi:transposase